MNHQSIKEQMIAFLKDEADKIGVKDVVVGISGGLDSAIVAILCQEVFRENMHGVLLPSQYSSSSSIEDAKELCEKFSIAHETVSIAPMVQGYFDNNEKDASTLRKGNFSARMRMAVLYDISAKYNAIVVGTSNRSEILLGYGTLYGDTACAINPLGNMYKSDEFAFGEYLGVPQSILTKKPSADLWEGQSDEEELGYSYKTMDDVLKEFVDKGISKEDLVRNGVDENLIHLLESRMVANAFKGKLPTIATIDFK